MRRGMCSTVTVLGLALGAVVGPLATGSSAQYPPAATDTCQLSATVTAPGGDLELSCSGMLAGATVFVDLFSTPTRLGQFSTDAQGRLNAVIEIPRSTPPGEHRLQVTAVAPDGRTQQESLMIMVAAPGTGGGDGAGRDRGNLSRTGSSHTAPLTAAAVGLVGIGAVSAVLARRRREAVEAGDA